MVNCETAEALIVREADGALSAAEREELDGHAAGCPRCRECREANLVVAPILARRVDAGTPPSLAVRVLAEVSTDERHGWFSGVNWRLWTEWMLPVTAVLALMVILVARSGTSVPAEAEPVTSAVEWSALATDDAGGVGVLSQDVTTEDLLAVMLGASTSGGGNDDGR
jgi:hypothetical protein